MSKEAAQRAMREARFKEMSARSTGSKPARAARPTQPPAAAAADNPVEPAAADGLCGHRSMNGRTCTREQGHSAKSHRYS